MGLHKQAISEDNILQLVDDYDIIVDAMDNFPVGYLLNKAAINERVPPFHEVVWGSDGRAMTIILGKTSWLRCLYSRAPPHEKFSVVRVTTGVIGCIQAAQVVKYIAGIGKLLAGRLLVHNGSTLIFTEVNVKRESSCSNYRDKTSEGVLEC